MTDEQAFTAALIQRDLYHDIADELAERIAKITGVEIGEHSSNNDPWMNAKYAADEYLAAPASAGVEEFPLPELPCPTFINVSPALGYTAEQYREGQRAALRSYSAALGLQAEPSTSHEEKGQATAFDRLHEDGFQRQEDWFVKNEGEDFMEQIHVDTIALIAEGKKP